MILIALKLNGNRRIKGGSSVIIISKKKTLSVSILVIQFVCSYFFGTFPPTFSEELSTHFQILYSLYTPPVLLAIERMKGKQINGRIK